VIRDTLADLVRAELAVGAAGASTPRPARELAVQYVVGAFMAVMTAWLDAGAGPAPEEVDAQFRRLALEGVFASDG